ncbi:hypothetical protein BC938DRAFT_471105 [Jimgerdemannia flammicorona]|uniref:F-box domain-containing protein n=1 Tax=Jimgerdemannia flammicorona TaxID=994334 RepID=A0A433Q8V8_9FUNG|nr:hypothetical protein BC938DRAFT_471105 [Jimgerdemannia flammicorona]
MSTTHIANVYPILEAISSYLTGADLKNFNMASQNLYEASRSRRFSTLFLRNCPFPSTLCTTVRKLIIKTPLFNYREADDGHSGITICQEIRHVLPTLDGTVRELEFHASQNEKVFDFVLMSLPSTLIITVRHGIWYPCLKSMGEKLKNVHELSLISRIIPDLPIIMKTLASFKDTLTSLTILDRSGRVRASELFEYAESNDIRFPYLRHLVIQKTWGIFWCPARTFLSVAPGLTSLELSMVNLLIPADDCTCRKIVLNSSESYTDRVAMLEEFLGTHV